MQNRLVQHHGTQRLVPAVNLGHFETLSQKERDPLGLLLGRGLARAHAVTHKNLCQKGYVWVTMVIERALFLLLAAVWATFQPSADWECCSGLVFLTKCPNYSINTPQSNETPCMAHVMLAVVFGRNFVTTFLALD